MYGFRIIAEGNYACFTRPELKVERVSYDVPTPGALEGMLKSIYWKPAIRYVIDKIVVFNPIDFMNIKRNEISNKISAAMVQKKMKDPKCDISVYADESRMQRSSMVLKNVKYGIEFHFELTGLKSENEERGNEKHSEIIRRRIENGQHFRMPCFGCSEFPVKSIRLVDSFDQNEIDLAIVSMGDVDLGYMLYRLQFEDKGIPTNNDWANPVYSDVARAVYYRPHMVNGIIDVARYAKEIKC